jgi:hypothetical protein
MLCTAGWTVRFKRVERIWRREGLRIKKSREWDYFFPVSILAKFVALDDQ